MRLCRENRKVLIMFSSSASNTPSRFKVDNVRKQFGKRVHAKAVHISSNAQCRIWYVQLAQTKMQSVIVKEVKYFHNSKRESTKLSVDWKFQDLQSQRRFLHGTSKLVTLRYLCSQSHHFRIQNFVRMLLLRPNLNSCATRYNIT